MIYRVSYGNQLELLAMRETGMGFQIVSARYQSEYNSRDFLILNAAIIIEMNQSFDDSLRQVLINENKHFVQDLKEKQLFDIQVEPEIKSFILAEKQLYKKDKGALDNPVEIVIKELFYCIRLSAYYDDKRIDRINKRLLPGSFTTSLEDFLACKFNKYDFIERYAMPNPEPVKWAFQIEPKIGVDSYQQGIVQPKFGHSGGGLEYFFEKGTSFGTFTSEADITA